MTKSATMPTKAPIIHSGSSGSLAWVALYASRSCPARWRRVVFSVFSAMQRGYGSATRRSGSGDRHLVACRRTGLDGLLVQPTRAVRRADQRPGQHAREADVLGLLAHRDELLGLHPAVHRVMAHRGP